MNSLTKRALVGGTLAAVGIALGLARCDRAPGPRQAQVADGGAGPGLVSPPERPVLEPRERRGTGPHELIGGVFDTAGNPVAGVEVSAELELGPGVDSLAPGAPHAAARDGGAVRDAGAGEAAGAGDGGAGGLDLRSPVVVTQSGADGSFALVGLEPGRHRLRVAGPGIFASEVRFFDVPAGGVRLIVARRVRIQGMVVDAAGAPVAGISVSAASEDMPGVTTSSTDMAGTFELDGLQEGVFQVWAARAAQAAPAMHVSRLGPGPFEPVRLVLEPAAIVTGLVVERGTEQGIAAAITLSATSSDEPARHVVSQQDGSFRVEGVPLGRWSAAAVAPGYVDSEAIELEVGRDFVPVLELTRGGIIAGQVVDHRGVPVTGAVVSARGVDTDGRLIVHSEQDQIRRLRRARGQPGAAVPGMVAGSNPRLVPRGELGVLLGPIPFPPPPGAHSLAIAQVLAEGGGAAAGPDPLGLQASAEESSMFVTDELGRFRITGLGAGTFRVMAHHRDYADGLSRPISTGPGKQVSELTVELSPGVVLVGQVSNQRGELIVGATIIADVAPPGRAGAIAPAASRAGAAGERLRRVVDQDSGLRLQAVTGTDGRYRLGPIGAGVTLRVTAVGHGDVVREVELGAQPAVLEERTEDFVLVVADAVLEGRITDPLGVAVRQAVVRIDSDDRVAQQWQAQSDASGRFAISRLPEGTHALIVRHPDYPEARVTGTTGETLDITVPFGGGIAAEIRDVHTGAPVAGARVVATHARQPDVTSASGEDGTLELVPLVPGVWTLAVSLPGYVSARRQVTVDAGQRPREITARDVRLELVQGATIAGTVRDSVGERVRGAVVAAGEVSVKTNEDGAFRLRDVPTGDTQVTAERGGARGVVMVPLAPGDEVLTLEITLDGRVE